MAMNLRTVGAIENWTAVAKLHSTATSNATLNVGEIAICQPTLRSFTTLKTHVQYRVDSFQSSKISGVGSTNFGLLVHVLPGPNERRVCKPSMLLS
jgi:hypothetical protein